MDASLPEELLLIAYNDMTGRRQGGATELGCGLAGAVLVELTLAGRVDVVDGRVRALDANPTGDPVLDDALARIATAKKARKPEWWVGKLNSGVQGRLLDRLVERGVLRRERHKVLGLFPVRRYPTLDAGLESAARSRLRSAVEHGTEPDARTAALAALLDRLRPGPADVPGHGPQAAQGPDEAIERGQWTSDAVRKAIQSIQAGVAAATVAATSTVAST